MVEKNPYWKRTFSKQRVDGWFDGKQQGRKKDIGERELWSYISEQFEDFISRVVVL